MNYSKLLVAMAVAGVLGSTATLAQAKDGVRLRCHSVGLADVSMDSRFIYKRRTGRLKFEARFEAAPGGAYEAGDLLPVSLAGITVGGMMLEERASGDLVGRFIYTHVSDSLAPDVARDRRGRDDDDDFDDDDSDSGRDDFDDDLDDSGLSLGGDGSFQDDFDASGDDFDIVGEGSTTDRPLHRIRVRKGTSVVVEKMGCALRG